MNKKDELKKKAISVATAASLLFGGGAADLSGGDDGGIDGSIFSPPAIIEYSIPDVVLDTPPEEEEKKKVQKTGIAAWKMSKRVAVAAPVVAASWVAGIVLCVVLANTLNVVMATALGWIVTAVLLLITYLAVAKVMFPEKKLKEFLNWKALLGVAGGATVLSIALKFILRT